MPIFKVTLVQTIEEESTVYIEAESEQQLQAMEEDLDDLIYNFNDADVRDEVVADRMEFEGEVPPGVLRGVRSGSIKPHHERTWSARASETVEKVNEDRYHRSRF
jgi:hypothetical protein